MNLTVGQHVWVKRIGNEARHLDHKKDATIEDYISEAQVTSVARKYFTLKSESLYLGRSRFCIDDGLEDGKGYSSGYRVYLNKQEILDEEESKNLHLEIREKYFGLGRGPIALEKLRAIKDILSKTDDCL